MSETISLHTRLKPGMEEAYRDAHANIPPELVSALKGAGVLSWRIWRSGQDLFHLIDVVDYAAMRHALRDHPANIPWQARMADLLEIDDDYSGTDTGLPLVWSLA